MAVHVTEKNDLVLLMVNTDKLFCKVDSWVKQTRWVWPSPIKISTNHVASIVSNYDSVWVKHGHNLKDKRVPQQLCLSIVLLQQELDCPMDHERCV